MYLGKIEIELGHSTLRLGEQAPTNMVKKGARPGPHKPMLGRKSVKQKSVKQKSVKQKSVKQKSVKQSGSGRGSGRGSQNENTTEDRVAIEPGGFL
jgi:hypothetical protein